MWSKYTDATFKNKETIGTRFLRVRPVWKWPYDYITVQYSADVTEEHYTLF